MDARTKRAFTRAQKALIELARVAAQDPESLNRSISLLVRSTGAILGTGLAAYAQPIERLHEGVAHAAKQVETHAIEGYSAYLAAERAQTEREH
jgi:hypothetical protein